MRVAHAVLVTIVVTVVLLSASVTPSGAASTQPPSGPMLITQRTFESAGDETGVAAYPNYFQPNPTAWWGRRGGTGSSGSYGLWCGQKPSGISYPKYPEWTSGVYDILLPELDGYYHSTVRFWYRYPSRGHADNPAFSFRWAEGLGPGYPIDGHVISGLNSTGVTLEYELSDPNNREINLSRKSGALRWRFIDREESPGGGVLIDGEWVIIYNPVRTGEGTTLDNIVVEGYAFGSVRNLGSSTATGGVELSWERPYAETGATTLEDRTVEYRIWRRPQSANPTDPWDEISISPLADASEFVTAFDGGASPGISYAYLVAPYAVGSTTVYGEPQPTTGRLSGLGLDIASTASPTDIVSGENVTFTYTLSNNGSVDLSDVMVSDEWGAVAGPLSLDVDELLELPARVRPITVSKSYSVSASSAAESLETSASSEFVRVLNPDISVSVSPSSRHANEGKHADFDVTVTNASPDAELTDVEVSFGTHVADAGVIAPGGSSVTLNLSIPVAQTDSLDVTAEGTFLPGRQVADDDGVSVDVVLEESRIAGATRIATAIESAKRLYPSGITGYNIDGRKAVVIATGYGFPDALSAASLAGASGGPLLLVTRNDATAAVLNYIKDDLGADYAYIVGGQGVVTDNVASQLRGIGLGVERLYGANRYATAEAVAKEVARIQSKKGDPVDTVFLATGLNFPDALAASSLAAAMPAPVLLTGLTTLPSSTDSALKLLTPSEVIVCGGTGVISNAVEASVKGNASYGNPDVERMPGLDRYATAKLINDWGLDNGLGDPAEIDGVFIATGMNYPDALAGGALAGNADGTWRPLVLTRSTSLATPAQTLILENEHVSFISVIGGSSVVSEGVELTAQGLID